MFSPLPIFSVSGLQFPLKYQVSVYFSGQSEKYKPKLKSCYNIKNIKKRIALQTNSLYCCYAIS